MIEGVYFDLDGTLADTAPDLAAATNQLLMNEGRATIPFTSLRPFVSGGSPALIKIAFGLVPGDADFERLRQSFLDIYAQAYFVKTQLFEGMLQCLNFLESRNISWGIITNKPDYLTRPLLKDIGLIERADVIICGDTYEFRKPHPYPLLKACELSNVEPHKSIYIGDDERDIIAAKAASMISVCAKWGYLSDQNPQDWNADHYVEQSEQLENFLIELLD